MKNNKNIAIGLHIAWLQVQWAQIWAGPGDCKMYQKNLENGLLRKKT